ncbi:theoredoxin domain containing protein,putative [Babesia caballi]|uniref:Theoredoxin domain containing protein,putative n=1 Tax=Babesia caballi TaxID=5871 RepID=A0AAV4LY05_BABCB|nr:theoredoxin domain containing protein,putative [Babesia caballi]
MCLNPPAMKFPRSGRDLQLAIFYRTSTSCVVFKCNSSVNGQKLAERLREESTAFGVGAEGGEPKSAGEAFVADHETRDVRGETGVYGHKRGGPSPEEPHEPSCTARPPSPRSHNDSAQRLYQRCLDEYCELSEGFITPPSEVEAEAGVDAEAYHTPAGTDGGDSDETASFCSLELESPTLFDRFSATGVWLPDQASESCFDTPREEASAGFGGIDSESAFHRLAEVSLGTPQRDFSVERGPTCISGRVADVVQSEESTKASAEGTVCSTPERRFRRFIRREPSRDDIEADKAKVRERFEKIANYRTVKVTAGSKHVPDGKRALVRDRHPDTEDEIRLRSLLAESIAEQLEKDCSTAQVSDSELPKLDAVAYREAVEKLSFSRHFGNVQTEWAPALIDAAIIVSEVVSSKLGDEEAEVLTPLDHEIVLTEAVVEQPRDNGELTNTARSDSVRTMHVNVLEDVVEAEEHQPPDNIRRNSTARLSKAKTMLEAYDTEVMAEVVLVTTSFGGVKRQFFQSRLAQHLLDCKGIVYYVVDANRDFTRARELKDRVLFDQWSSEGLLKTEEKGDRSSVTLPQLLIDGVSIGCTRAAQDLEDDGDLDYMIARMVCPGCLSEKPQDALQCPHCNVVYRSLIPPEYVDGVDIQRMCQGVLFGADGTAIEV